MNTERNSTFLMANLGSEVSRMVSAKKGNDFTLLKSAYERAKNIIIQIKSCIDMKVREKEIDILDDVVSDLMKEKPIFSIQPDNLLSYFRPFMLKAFRV